MGTVRMYQRISKIPQQKSTVGFCGLVLVSKERRIESEANLPCGLREIDPGGGCRFCVWRILHQPPESRSPTSSDPHIAALKRTDRPWKSTRARAEFQYCHGKSRSWLLSRLRRSTRSSRSESTHPTRAVSGKSSKFPPKWQNVDEIRWKWILNSTGFT